MPIFRPNVPTVLLEYIDLFESKWQHKHLGGAPCPLLHYIATFHFKPSYCS